MPSDRSLDLVSTPGCRCLGPFSAYKSVQEQGAQPGHVLKMETRLEMTILHRKPVRVFFGLLVIIIAAQLLNIALVQHRPEAEPRLFSDPGSLANRHAPVLGPSDADLTIYLFTDYACPNCRILHRNLRALLASDRKIRIVYRDWPILGERSRAAARLAIASAEQSRHDQFDDELMRRGGLLDDNALQAAATRAGVDWPRLQRTLASDRFDIDRLIDDSGSYARGIGLSGTPTMVVGPYIVEGRVSLERLRELVGNARK